MKKLIIPFVFIGVLFSGAFFSGCYTDTVDALSTFDFQLPLIFHSTHFNKASPDTSVDFTNLNEYKEYRDNKERIQEAIVHQFNYWIDDIKLSGSIPMEVDHLGRKPPENDMQDSALYFHPERDNLEFEFIKFYLHFAKLKDGYYNENDLVESHWEIDTTEKPYLLGAYYDVDVSDYYRQAHHIIEVSDEISAIISEAVKERPSFFIITEYSKTKDQDDDKRYFPYVGARYDMVIRFSVDL